MWWGVCGCGLVGVAGWGGGWLGGVWWGWGGVVGGRGGPWWAVVGRGGPWWAVVGLFACGLACGPVGLWACGPVGLWACVVVAPPGCLWRFCFLGASWLLVVPPGLLYSPASSWGLLLFLILPVSSWLLLVARATILMTLIFFFCR